MNGEMLPLLNGYPLRLVVPGWFATYWIKMLSDIEVLTVDADDSYFMAKSYRMPTVPVKPGDKDFPTVPITTMGPRSWVTSHSDGAEVKHGELIQLRGIAIGGDAGVKSISLTGFLPQDVKLEGPSERYGFRRWTAAVRAVGVDLTIAVRCTNTNGVTQPDAQAWNPSGYARNVVERITLNVV